MRYARSIIVDTPPEVAFRYLADFANAAEWDPGIAEARRLTPPPTDVGSRFEVIALFRGKRQRFEYLVCAFDEGREIALRGDGAKAVSDDRITVRSAAGARSSITYEAELRLKGLYRMAEPFLGSVVRKMGDAALDGLAARLGQPVSG